MLCFLYHCFYLLLRSGTFLLFVIVAISIFYECCCVNDFYNCNFGGVVCLGNHSNIVKQKQCFKTLKADIDCSSNKYSVAASKIFISDFTSYKQHYNK